MKCNDLLVNHEKNQTHFIDVRLVSDIMEIKRHGISLILDLFDMCTCGGQKTGFDALGLKLQTTMSHCVYTRT